MAVNFKTAYNNNLNLKKPNINHEYTEHEIKELIKCKKDIIYFAENYVKIVTLDEGTKLIKMFDYQKKIIKNIMNNRFNIILAARQSGKTTSCLIPILWSIIFKSNWTAAILTNKLDNSIQILDRLKGMYENLPFWLKHGTLEWAKSFIQLENKSSVIAEATTPNSGRSLSLNYIYLDEFAMVPDNIANDFYASTYPTISSGKHTKMIISSTPNGYNLFYKIYNEARLGKNSFVPIQITWKDVPGRDEKWKTETLKNISENIFRVEYECEFLGSSNTLIDASKLETLTYINPVKVENNLHYFKFPVEGKKYLTTLDMAEGLGNDYTAFTVFDISKFPNEVVCTFKSKTIRPLEVPPLLYRVLRYYNNSYLLCEINYSPEVPLILFNEYEYENILSTKKSNTCSTQILTQGYGNEYKLGVKTTTNTKRLSSNLLKNLVECDKIILNDERIILELFTFVKTSNSYQAEKGYNDDLVSTLLIYCWCLSQQYFKDIVKNNVRNSLIKQYEDEVKSNYETIGGIYSESFDRNINEDREWQVIYTLTNDEAEYFLNRNKNYFYFNTF